jgi:kynureninase
VPRIRERSLALTQLLIDLADDAGLEVVSPREPGRRGGTVTVSTPDHAACHKELGERGIVCDFRPDPMGGVRLGPHFFNTEEEVRGAVGALADIVATRAYERHLGATPQF